MDSFMRTFQISGFIPHQDRQTNIYLPPLPDLSKSKENKKPRTSFSQQQLSILESRFEQQKYLTASERAVLSKLLRMSDSQVKTWFQNRRTKWRRQIAETNPGHFNLSQECRNSESQQHSR